MSWYKEGTVNIEQGSKTVTGIGTKWANPLIGVCAGQMLILKTSNTIEIYEIASLQSDTQLTLANQYSGASKKGVSYEIPTAPKMSIEALALRISEMLNYYQQQMDGWQSILTGTGDITLTAPDGRIVTIKSQTSISNELIKLVGDSESFSESASQSATNADSSAQSALNSSNDATESAKSASQSASEASASAQQSADSAQEASQSATNANESAQTAQSYASNAETSANNAAQSATEAKNAIESIGASIDTSNFIKKSGEENQSIDGSLNVDELTEKGVRVYSPNNKPSADDIGSLPATKKVVDDAPIYMVGNQVNFEQTLTVNGKSVLTHDDIKQLNERISIVESYQNGDSWYNKYSNGFIEQSGVVKVTTGVTHFICDTLVNLLTPMKTQNYSVIIGRINSDSWANVYFSQSERSFTDFHIASYASYTGVTDVRWTVRGY